jgi:hypothetical protein
MAVVNLKTAQITNRDAVPIVMQPANIAEGMKRGAVGTIELANGDSIASTYRFFQVPSNAVIHNLQLYCDAITSGAGDIGIYQTPDNGGAVVDVDFFASAQSIASAITTGTEVQHEADATDAGAGFGLADIEKMLWQALGLTADPVRYYDVVLTLTAATTAAGTVALKCTYTTNVG